MFDYLCWREQDGAVAAEFALVATILVLLCMLCFEMAMMMQAQLVLTTASREGAREAAVHGGWSTEVQQRIDGLLQMGGLCPEEAAVMVQPAQAAYGRPIEVGIGYAYPLRTQMLRSVLPPTVHLSARVVTRSERLDER